MSAYFIPGDSWRALGTIIIDADQPVAKVADDIRSCVHIKAVA